MIRGNAHKWFQSYLVKLLLRDNESKWSFVYECDHDTDQTLGYILANT